MILGLPRVATMPARNTLLDIVRDIQADAKQAGKQVDKIIKGIPQTLSRMMNRPGLKAAKALIEERKCSPAASRPLENRGFRA